MDVRSVVNDARVLLRQLQGSRWGELHVRTPQGEVFIARHGGGPNPMHRGAAMVVASTGVPSDAVLPEAAQIVRAPHVGTVLAVEPARTPVGSNAIICRLAVLDAVIEVTSPQAGVVGEVLVVEGALVDYESPLCTIVPAQ